MTYKYEQIRPTSTYAPWLMDVEFQRIWPIVANYSLVDRYRMFELWKLVKQSAKLPLGDLLEVGVWQGGSGATIAVRAAQSCPNARVFLCDTFTGTVKAGELDPNYKDGTHSVSRDIAEGLFSLLALTNVTVLSGVFPDHTGAGIEDRLFRFVHVDVDIYQSAFDIMEWVWPRLVVGGIVVFDDYGFDHCQGITRLVEDEMSLDDRIVVHNLNGHAIMVKIK